MLGTAVHGKNDFPTQLHQDSCNSAAFEYKISPVPESKVEYGSQRFTSSYTKTAI